MAPSSGGSSLLSVYLGWCYALAPCTKEKRPKESAKRLQDKPKEDAERKAQRTKANFNTFNGSGPTCAGFTATPDDSEEGSFLRVRPP